MEITRRDVLKLAAAGGVAGLAGCAVRPAPVAGGGPASGPAMPAVFLSHGSPMVALAKDDYAKALAKMGTDLPTPKAILVVSAHWMDDLPVKVTGGAKPEMIYDFGGFPDELYKINYPSPGHPALATEIAGMLQGAGFAARLEDRGLDHGAWVPLTMAYPGADLPVLEVTLPLGMGPGELVKLGRAIAPLRRRGVLVIGSGGMTHNFERGSDDPTEKPDAWARKFEEWVVGRMEAHDVAALVDWQVQAPHAEIAHPTTEHFDPLFVVLGATAPGDRVKDVYVGWRNANFSMRTFAMG